MSPGVGNQGHQKTPETASLAEGNSQNLNKQLGACMGPTQALCIYSTVFSLVCLFVGPRQWEQGCCWYFWLAHGNLFFMLHSLVQPEYKGKCLFLVQLDMQCCTDAQGRPTPF